MPPKLRHFGGVRTLARPKTDVLRSGRSCLEVKRCHFGGHDLGGRRRSGGMTSGVVRFRGHDFYGAVSAVEDSTPPLTLRRSQTLQCPLPAGTVCASALTMLHVVAHAVSGDFLWRCHEEGLALWTRLLALQPAALCLMPDHIHVLTERYDCQAFARLLSGFTRWRHHRRGGHGQVWMPHPEPVRPSGPLHLQRTHRYIALNPCRDGLTTDPLAWAWSTHRDTVGFAAPPVLRPARDPDRQHAYVSADPSVAVDGTMLPLRRVDAGRPGWGSLVAAVSALTRRPVEFIAEPGHARQLLVAAAREIGGFPATAVAPRLGVSRATIHRELPVRRELLDLVARVLDEPRFPALGAMRLDLTPRWRSYMQAQPARRRRKDWLYA